MGTEDAERRSVFSGAVRIAERAAGIARAWDGERDVIVTCEECSTSFQLDDARIPASGARVRCSRCKHAFFLPNPSASQSQAVHAVVADTLDGESMRAPAPDRDLAGPRGAEPEEEDWQFSQEIRVADDEPEEGDRGHGSSPRADSFDLTGDFGRGFDPETFERVEPTRAAPTKPTAVPSPRADAPKAAAAPTPAAAPAPSPAIAAESKREESSFGSIDDFSSLIDDDDVSIDLATEPVTEARRSATKPASRATPSRAVEDLGDPESWDLVGPGSERKPAPSAPSIARTPPASSPARKKKSSKAGLDLFADSELPPIREDGDESPRSASLAARLRGAGRIVGGVVTMLCVLAVGVTLLRPEWSRFAPTPQRIEVGPLVAETTRIGWVETSRAGFLLVVEGELRNTGRQPIAPMAVQLALLDGDGSRLSAPALRVGQPLAPEALRESGAEDLVRQVDQACAGWLSAKLAPGETRRFTAVVRAEDMPPAARRILLEAGAPSGS